MKLVKCDMSDHEALTALYDKVTAHLEAHINYPKWQPGVYPGRESIKNAIERGMQYACLDGDRMVGACIINDDPQGDYSLGEWRKELAQGEFGVLHAVAADPDLSGKGVGRFIVKTALELVREAGYQAVRIDVVPDNVPALKLYEKCGFLYAGEKDLGRGIEEIPTFALYELNFE